MRSLSDVDHKRSPLVGQKLYQPEFRPTINHQGLNVDDRYSVSPAGALEEADNGDHERIRRMGLGFPLQRSEGSGRMGEAYNGH